MRNRSRIDSCIWGFVPRDITHRGLDLRDRRVSIDNHPVKRLRPGGRLSMAYHFPLSCNTGLKYSSPGDLCDRQGPLTDTELTKGDLTRRLEPLELAAIVRRQYLNIVGCYR